MNQYCFGEDYHNGHEFDLPRKSTSVCRGCGDTWSKIVSHTRWCGESEPATKPLNLIPAAGLTAVSCVANEVRQAPFKRPSFWGWITCSDAGGASM